LPDVIFIPAEAEVKMPATDTQMYCRLLYSQSVARLLFTTNIQCISCILFRTSWHL